MVGEEVSKAVAPVMKALEPVLQSRAMPGNLNDTDLLAYKFLYIFLRHVVNILLLNIICCLSLSLIKF